MGDQIVMSGLLSLRKDGKNMTQEVNDNNHLYNRGFIFSAYSKEFNQELRVWPMPKEV